MSLLLVKKWTRPSIDIPWQGPWEYTHNTDRSVRIKKIIADDQLSYTTWDRYEDYTAINEDTTPGIGHIINDYLKNNGMTRYYIIIDEETGNIIEEVTMPFS